MRNPHWQMWGNLEKIPIPKIVDVNHWIIIAMVWVVMMMVLIFMNTWIKELEMVSGRTCQLPLRMLENYYWKGSSR